VVKSSDPKVDAIVRLASLAGFDGDHTREIVAAFDPGCVKRLAGL